MVTPVRGGRTPGYHGGCLMTEHFGHNRRLGTGRMAGNLARRRPINADIPEIGSERRPAMEIESALDEDQLLSYLTWRDTKAALLLFIRDRDVTTAISHTEAALGAPPNFKRRAARPARGERHDFILHANGGQRLQDGRSVPSLPRRHGPPVGEARSALRARIACHLPRAAVRSPRNSLPSVDCGRQALSTSGGIWAAQRQDVITNHKLGILAAGIRRLSTLVSAVRGCACEQSAQL